MVRLGDVCEVVLGGTPKTGITEYWDGDIPWLTPGDMGKITQMYVDASNCKRKISQLGLDNGSTLCPARSVILSTRAPIGYAFVNSVPMATNQGCKTLVPSDDVYSEYLCFNLLGRTDELNELGTGTTFKELATGRLKAMTLPLPPLSVQREIVARLERELAAVEKMNKGFEELAETAKAEFKAELKEVFEEISRGGAETRRLGDAFRFVDYRGMTPNKITSGVPLITAKNIRFGYMDYRERFYISEEDYAKRQTRGVARCGDILFTTEAPMGYVALADQKRFSTGQRIITFQWPNATEHDNRYFLYYFMSDVFQGQVRENASGATAQGIKSSRLVNLSVLIPGFQKQRQIADRLDSAKARAEKLEAKAREGMAVCETMRKAILKEAFE